jgi:hypothetical protein
MDGANCGLYLCIQQEKLKQMKSPVKTASNTAPKYKCGALLLHYHAQFCEPLLHAAKQIIPATVLRISV